MQSDCLAPTLFGSGNRSTRGTLRQFGRFSEAHADETSACRSGKADFGAPLRPPAALTRGRRGTRRRTCGVLLATQCVFRVLPNIDGGHIMMAARPHLACARHSTRKAALLVSLAVSSLALPTLAFAVEETKADTIGPWEIEATFEGRQIRSLHHRSQARRRRRGELRAHRRRSRARARIAELEARSRQDLSGEDECRPAQLRYRGHRRAELGVDGRQGQEICRQSWRSANALNVVAAGATIRVPLDQSTAAFERLDQCVEKNSKAVEANPFLCGSDRSAVTAGASEGQGPECLQETKAESETKPGQETKASTRPNPRSGSKPRTRDLAGYRRFCEGSTLLFQGRSRGMPR